MSEPAHLLPTGVFHGRYEVVRCIAAGGMGAVYEVTHVQTERSCALKVMLPGLVKDPKQRDRFQREARVTAKIKSDHIVQILDAGVDDETGLPFLVMELLEGRTLRASLEKSGRLPVGEALALLRQIALALDKTHAAGIVHRDLKPANLFITEADDGSPRMKILDFGIAKIMAGQGGQTTLGGGTPLFMAPEQIREAGTIGSACDLYALAHIAFAMLVGKPYWGTEYAEHTSEFAFLARVLLGTPVPASYRAASYIVELPIAFDEWFARGVNESPSLRFSSAHNMADALADTLTDYPDAQPLPQATKPYSAPPTRPSDPQQREKIAELLEGSPKARATIADRRDGKVEASAKTESGLGEPEATTKEPTETAPTIASPKGEKQNGPVFAVGGTTTTGVTTAAGRDSASAGSPTKIQVKKKTALQLGAIAGVIVLVGWFVFRSDDSSNVSGTANQGQASASPVTIQQPTATHREGITGTAKEQVEPVEDGGDAPESTKTAAPQDNDPAATASTTKRPRSRRTKVIRPVKPTTTGTVAPKASVTPAKTTTSPPPSPSTGRPLDPSASRW